MASRSLRAEAFRRSWTHRYVGRRAQIQRALAFSRLFTAERLFQQEPLCQPHLVRQGHLSFQTDGRPVLNKQSPSALPALQAIQALGGDSMVQRVLATWSEHVRDADEDLMEELDARIMAATDADGVERAFTAMQKYL